MKTSQIECTIYTSANHERYNAAIQQFDCSLDSNTNAINEALRRALQYNVTTILFIDSQNNCIIGFCSFCCSSLKIGDDVRPAMLIESFGIDKRYQNTSLEDDPLPCSAFILEYCVAYLTEISHNYIYAKYVILYSLQNQNTLRFYLKNGFGHFDANNRSLRRRGESNDIYSLFRVIDTLDVGM